MDGQVREVKVGLGTEVDRGDRAELAGLVARAEPTGQVTRAELIRLKCNLAELETTMVEQMTTTAGQMVLMTTTAELAGLKTTKV